MPRKRRKQRRLVVNVPVPLDLHNAVKDAARKEDRSVAQWARYTFRKALGALVHPDEG